MVANTRYMFQLVIKIFEKVDISGHLPNFFFLFFQFYSPSYCYCDLLGLCYSYQSGVSVQRSRRLLLCLVIFIA